MMSRKNYTRAIELMEGLQLDYQDFQTVTRFLVEFFKEDNPLFNQDKFLTTAYDNRKRLLDINN